MATSTYFDNINPLVTLERGPSYKNPTEAILTNLNARTNYFVQGVQRVKSVEDTTETFGLNLTKEKYKNEFKSLKQEADDKFKNFSTSDFSIASNQKTAEKFFTPITQNSNFIDDTILTKKLNEVYSAAKNDANRKGNTFGYNSDFVNYNRLMQNKYAKSQIDDASFYLNDKFIGAYQSNPSKEEEDYYKNLEKQYLQSTTTVTNDPNNPLSLLYTTTKRIDADAVRADLLQTMPQTLKNQKEIQSRLGLMLRQETMSSEDIIKDYKDRLSYIVEDKVRDFDVAILNLQGQIAANASDPSKKEILEKDLATLTKRKKDALENFKSIKWEELTDKDDLNKGFKKAFDVDFEWNAYTLSRSLGRVVEQKNEIKKNEGLIAAKDLVLKATQQNDKTTTTTDRSEGYNPVSLVDKGNPESESKQVFDYFTGADKGTQRLTVQTQSILDKGLGLKIGNESLSEYIKNNSNLPFENLKDKLSKENYDLVLKLASYSYIESGEAYKKGYAPVLSTFKGKSLGEMFNRLKHTFTSKEMLEGVAKQAAIKVNDSAVWRNIIMDMESAKLRTEEEFTDFANISKSAISNINSPFIDSKKLNALNPSEFSNFEEAVSKVVDLSSVEKQLDRKFTNEEKNRIGKYLISGNIEDLGVIKGLTVKSVKVPRNPGGFEIPTEVIAPVTNWLGFNENAAYDILQEQIRPTLKSLKESVLKGIEDKKLNPSLTGKTFVIASREKEASKLTSDEITTSEFNTLLDNISYTTLEGTNEATESEELIKFLKSNQGEIAGVKVINMTGGKDPVIQFNVKQQDAKSSYKDITDQNTAKAFKFTVPRNILEGLNIIKRQTNIKDQEDIQTRGSKTYPSEHNGNFKINSNNAFEIDKEVYFPFFVNGKMVIEKIDPSNLNAKLQQMDRGANVFTPQGIRTQPNLAADKLSSYIDAGKLLFDLIQTIPEEDRKTLITNHFLDVSKLSPELINKINQIKTKYSLNSQEDLRTTQNFAF